MAEISLFFNAQRLPDGSYDREYLASDVAEYFGSVLSTGLLHTDEEPAPVVSVETGTLNTVLSVGKAIINGHLYNNTTPLTLTHSMPESSLDRIDRIVLRWDARNAGREILAHVKEGTPASSPTAPELQRDNFIHEISLASVLIRKNTSSISPGDITDERYYENLCGFVNSILGIPTDQFLAEWKQFLAERNEEFDAASGDFEEQMEYFQKQWDDWIYDIQSDTFARVTDKQSGKVYKLIMDDEELFLEEV